MHHSIPSYGFVRRIAVAFLVLIASIFPAAPAQAQIVGKSCGADTGWSQTAANSGTNMSCINNVWQFPAYQFGLAWGACNSATAGMVQWTGSALQYCDSTSWATLGNSSGVGSATGSTGDVQFNSAGALAGSNNLFWNNSGAQLGIGTATMNSALQVYGGEAQVGSGGGSCTSSNAGAIRYTSGSGLQYCNGSSWTNINTISNTAGNVGYWVLSKGTYTGSLGGLSGADSTCLTDLTTNTGWMGYSTALAAGQLVSGNVHAFLCDASSFCDVIYPNTTYYFANANNATYGGASFTTNGYGYGPGDTNAWSGSTYFNYSNYYWTGHGNTGSSYWYDNNNGNTCTGWTSTSGTGGSGLSTQTNGGRIAYTNNNCSSSYPLICVVNPQQQVVTQGADVGWFVTLATTANGNRGGLSGANSSCLSALQSGGWLGYQAANANGQLTSSKVFAFLCDGTTCNNLQANTTYYFSYSGDVTAGGGSFTTDANGLGPNDSIAWSIASRFAIGANNNAYTGRGTTSNTAWANTSSTNTCNGWTNGTSSYNGDTAQFTNTNSGRWNATSQGCGAGWHWMCFVNP